MIRKSLLKNVQHVDINKARMLFGHKQTLQPQAITVKNRVLSKVADKNYARKSEINGMERHVLDSIRKDSSSVRLFQDNGEIMYNLVFGNSFVHNVLRGEIGLAGLNEVNCVITEVAVYVEEQKKRYAIPCIVHNTDGVIAYYKNNKDAVNNSIYYNAVRDLIANTLIKELNDTDNTKYALTLTDRRNGIGVVTTKHFKGLFEYLDSNYMHVKFVVCNTDPSNYNYYLDTECYMGDGVFSFIVSTRNGKVIGNRAYLDVIRFDKENTPYKNCIMTVYETKPPRCKEVRFVNQLIDLKTGRILLEGMKLNIERKVFIKAIKNENTKAQTLSVFIWDDKTNSLKTLLDDVSCSGDPAVKENCAYIEYRDKTGEWNVRKVPYQESNR